MTKKTHWRGDTGRTLCGMTGRPYVTNVEDDVTCVRCQISDGKRQREQYRQEVIDGVHPELLDEDKLSIIRRK